eukprot:10455262-Alexandrium_andersonii.AAC.1
MAGCYPSLGAGHSEPAGAGGRPQRTPRRLHGRRHPTKPGPSPGPAEPFRLPGPRGAPTGARARRAWTALRP